MQRALVLTHSVFGAGICSALAGLPDWSVTSLFTCSPERLVNLAEDHHPTVTIIDTISLDVLDLFRQLGQARIMLFGRVIVATLSGLDEEMLFYLNMWGVAAHISASTEPDDLADILRKVTEDQYLLSSDCLAVSRASAPRPQKAKEVRAVPIIRIAPISADASLASPLTAREAEILGFIAQGMTNKEIAAKMGLEASTIKTYITQILKKLKVFDRTSAVVIAWQREWIPAPEQPHKQAPRRHAVA